MLLTSTSTSTLAAAEASIERYYNGVSRGVVLFTSTARESLSLAVAVLPCVCVCSSLLRFIRLQTVCFCDQPLYRLSPMCVLGRCHTLILCSHRPLAVSSYRPL